MVLRQDKRGVRLGSKGRGRKDGHCAKDHAQKYGLLAANRCARRRTWRCHNVLPLPELQQFPSGRLCLVGLCWKEVHSLWCAICGEKYDWKQLNRLLVVQTGESVEQAKVFKAHAIPQGFCEHLINALKLLANQQEDGYGLLQNIVTNLRKGSRKGLTDGLRDFIKADNNRALDVGEPRRGTGTCKVRKPKVPERGV